jgi:hypothetical protein
MNSKEAVNSVLEHRQPDYIPIGTYAIDCDTVQRIIGHETYVRNKVNIQIAMTYNELTNKTKVTMATPILNQSW